MSNTFNLQFMAWELGHFVLSPFILPQLTINRTAVALWRNGRFNTCKPGPR